MIDVIVPVGWAVGALILFRPVFRGLLKEVTCGRPDWADICFGLFITAVMVGVFWPVVLAFFTLRATVGTKDPARFAAVVGGESSEQKTARLERERADRERYIDRLERELEIGPYAKDAA